jgi:hypothetical protein
MATSLKTILIKVKQPGFFPNHYEIIGINDFGTYNPKKKLHRLQENKNEILDLSDQTKLTRLINQADKILKDQTLRSKYDKQLREVLNRSEPSSPKRNRRPVKNQATIPQAYTKGKSDYIESSAFVLGAMNILGTLGLLYLNWGVFSWYYSLFIALASLMLLGLLKALSIKPFNEVITEDNGILFTIIGGVYYFYNQELLALALVAIVVLLLMKLSFIRKFTPLVRAAPIIYTILVLCSIWVVPDLNEKYFPNQLQGLTFLPFADTPQDTIVKTYVEAYGRWNIRETPNGKEVSTTIPGQIYEILGVTNTAKWYHVVTEQDTGVIHLTQQKGRFFQDTFLIK